MNFGTTLNLLQVNKNFISNETLSHFKEHFSDFSKVVTASNPLYYLSILYIMFPQFRTDNIEITNYRNNTSFFIKSITR